MSRQVIQTKKPNVHDDAPDQLPVTTYCYTDTSPKPSIQKTLFGLESTLRKERIFSSAVTCQRITAPSFRNLITPVQTNSSHAHPCWPRARWWLVRLLPGRRRSALLQQVSTSCGHESVFHLREKKTLVSKHNFCFMKQHKKYLCLLNSKEKKNQDLI